MFFFQIACYVRHGGHRRADYLLFLFVYVCVSVCVLVFACVCGVGLHLKDTASARDMWEVGVHSYSFLVVGLLGWLPRFIRYRCKMQLTGANVLWLVPDSPLP